MKILGVSTRVDIQSSYKEQRSCLSQDWFQFFQTLDFDVLPILIPNHHATLDKMLKELKFDAFILTGGNDIGESPERDELESSIIQHCKDKTIPLLGVCRGLQMLNYFENKKLTLNLEKVINEKHVNCSHKLKLDGSHIAKTFFPNETTVNSYHNHGVLLTDLADSYTAFATTEKGCVEGIAHKTFPILGIQWHPERGTPNTFDKELIQKLITHKKFWN